MEDFAAVSQLDGGLIQLVARRDLVIRVEEIGFNEAGGRLILPAQAAAGIEPLGLRLRIARHEAELLPVIIRQPDRAVVSEAIVGAARDQQRETVAERLSH